MRAARAGAALLALGAATGCELTEVSLAEPTDLVVVEAYVRVRPDANRPGEGRWRAEPTAFLHRTLEVDGSTGPPPPAVLTVRGPGGSWRLTPTDARACVISRPVIVDGTCYAADELEEAAAAPGDRLTLEVDVADGRRLTAETTVPGAFALLDVPEAGACTLPPGTTSELRWTASEGTWAYITEAFVGGLAELFPDADVDDPLYLLGLSISATDTTVVFPSEVGLFERAELDREVAVALQAGLPPGTSAALTVTAVERNWVNWARGGNFNPSGQVRVPSVRGEGGTGVFAAGVVLPLQIAVPDVPPDGPAGRPTCPPPPRESAP